MRLKFKKLTQESQFEQYSDKLKKFEKEFTYPLGDETFTISHGNDGSYFDFFKKLGKVFYFVIEDKDRIVGDDIVGVGCAILRSINGEKIWYLCDFKILKEYRGKGLLSKLAFRYFFPLYFYSRKMIAVNMSVPKNNSLVRNIFNIFSLFKVECSHSYFYEFTSEKIKTIKENKYIKNNFVAITNDGQKDIIVRNKPVKLTHLIKKEYAEQNFSGLCFSVDNLNEDHSLMFCTIQENIKVEIEKNLNISPSYEISFINYGINKTNLHFTSAEI